MYKRAIYGHKQGNYKLLELWCQLYVYITSDFEVLVTVHLSIILATDQLNAQILAFFIKLIIFLYMFWAMLCSSSGGQIVLYSIWYHHTCRWPSSAHWVVTYRCDDTRCCIIQFDLMMSTIVLEICRGI